jgi:hypothetical protein
MQTTKPITAQSIEPSKDVLVIRLTDRKIEIRWEQCSPKLASATEEQRRFAELSPGGYGIHWPLIDEDLSIHGLVGKIG